MHRRLVVGLGILVIAALAAGGWWWSAEQQAAEARILRASGMLEATEVMLAPEFGGRVESRPVRAGDRVRAGDVLARLDTEILEHKYRMADTADQLILAHQIERQTLRAPLDGWVVRTVFEVGEVAPAGAPVVVVADWRELTLKVYLPEDRFGRVALGQTANVSVDAYPGETFDGTVTYIASEAEFTPRNVQTREDRVKSVYAVKLRVPNSDLRLKPGMFADAVFAQ